jgi:hypothetical protein
MRSCANLDLNLRHQPFKLINKQRRSHKTVLKLRSRRRKLRLNVLECSKTHKTSKT